MEGLSDTGEKVKAVLFFFFNPPRVRVEGNGNPLQHTCLENSMVRGVQKAAVQQESQS